MLEKNKISNGSVNWLLFFNIILYVVITEVVIFVNSYFTFEQPDTYTTRIVVQLFAILIPVIIFTKSRNINVKSFFRINYISLKNVVLLVGLGFCSQFIGLLFKLFVRLIFNVFKIPYAVNTYNISLPETGFQTLLAVTALMILPVLAEELLFRGLVLRSYEKWGTRSAIVISALLFSLLHLDISGLPATLFMGFLLSYVVIKTDSLIAGLILHFVNNSVAFLLAMFPVGKIALMVLFIIALIVFLPLLLSFYKNNIKSKSIPQKRSIASEITRTVFTLPILLSIIAFIIVQLYVFNIF